MLYKISDILELEIQCFSNIWNTYQINFGYETNVNLRNAVSH